MEFILFLGFLGLVWGIGQKINKPKDEFADVDIEYEFIDKDAMKEATSVVMKEPSFNVNAIEEYTGESIKKFEFRPQNFIQFIGQTEAKDKARTIIKKAHRGIKCHFLVDGIRGHGKTTFVEIVAKELGAKIIKRVGKQVDEDNLVEIINEINSSQEKFVIFFIDEIDTMDWRVVKVLNPIIESFEIAGKKIKPFIFASATINKHILIDKTPDTLDRISTHIKFARYDDKEIGQILAQYQKQLYAETVVPQEVIETISKNCKFNPRTSIALLEDYIVEVDMTRVLNSSKIVTQGLTKKDIEILYALSKSTRAMGANALAMKVGLSPKEYTTEFEPFLVEYDYVNRVPSRVITDKGKKLLEEVKL